MRAADILEVKVQNMYGRTDYKFRASINDKKKLKQMLEVLKFKFGVDVALILNDSSRDWF